MYALAEATQRTKGVTVQLAQNEIEIRVRVPVSGQWKGDINGKSRRDDTDAVDEPEKRARTDELPSSSNRGNPEEG